MLITAANSVPLYIYKATVLRWVDGDTVELHVDLGFRFTMTDSFRLNGIDTPERGDAGYNEATAFARYLAPEGIELITKTYKNPDKYGRWLADLFVGDTFVNISLISSGHAVTYYGGKKIAEGPAFLGDHTGL